MLAGPNQPFAPIVTLDAVRTTGSSAHLYFKMRRSWTGILLSAGAALLAATSSDAFAPRQSSVVRVGFLAPRPGSRTFRCAIGSNRQEQHRRRYHHITRSVLQAQNAGSVQDDKSKKEEDEANEEEDDDDEDEGLFDIREFWKNQDPKEFWNSVRSNSDDDHDATEKQKMTPADDMQNGVVAKVVSSVDSALNDEEDSSSSMFELISSRFLGLIARGDDDNGEEEDDDDETGDTISDIVASVRKRSESEQGDDQETSLLTEIYTIIQQYGSSLDEVVQKFLGDIVFSRLSPTALLYHLEYQDEVKNPSFKRRSHRFCPGINPSKVDKLYDALKLARMAYSDTVQELQQDLKEHTTPHELVYCRIKSQPGQPAYFLAVQRHSPDVSFIESSDALHVTLVVRGTKSVADAITDLLCKETDYMGGKAHSFIVDSGRWVVEQSRDLLLELLESSGKSRIQLTIVGHSLGAGAASIAGMELNAMEDSRIEVEQVMGFGCPAMVSKDLADKADFITTIVNNDDCVPRLSGISVANLLLDVLEFDWLPYAKNDIQSALDALQDRQEFIFNDDVVKKIMETVEPLMEKHLRATIMDKTGERLDVELFPPGKCVHFYRDGVGYSASFVPNTFFSEIDLSRSMIVGTYNYGYTDTSLAFYRPVLPVVTILTQCDVVALLDRSPALSWLPTNVA